MTLYILDDDKTELELWKINIEKICPQYLCKTFTLFDDFKNAVELFPPTAAIIDFVMPFNSGIDVCKWIKEKYNNIPVFINTSLDGDEYKILAERCNATYLSKKLNFNERLKVVNDGCKS